MFEWRGPLHPAKRLACGDPYAPRRSPQPPKIARGRKARSAGGDTLSPARLALARRPRSAARQNAASAYRPLCWRWVPNPTPRSLACAAFCHLSRARAASSVRRRETQARWCSVQGALSAAGRQAFSARGAPPPLALLLDFARRSSRRRYGAGERFFRALRPGLRRDMRRSDSPSYLFLTGGTGAGTYSIITLLMTAIGRPGAV